MRDQIPLPVSLSDRLDENQDEVCEILDVIEDNLWGLSSDVREFRIRLSRLESLKEKLSAAQ